MLRKNPWVVIFIFCLLVPVVLIGVSATKLWLGNEYILAVTLNGERQVTVECGTEYVEQGASAAFFGSMMHVDPESVPVTVTGNVNTDRIGTYTVAYRAELEDHVGTAYRRVCVVDTQCPVITLQTVPEFYTLPGQAYVEEGFAATDNYDGDITDRVFREENNGIVTYSVADSSGNKTVITRKILYLDPIAPELTLVGGNEVTIYAGTVWQDPGYLAMDNCDGDITDQVKISGSEINTFYKGSQYDLVYTVSDAFGNCVSATRRVTVIPHPKPQTSKPEGKVIYLTFDDGPGEYTEALLDVLEKYGIKATFFVVNTEYVDLLTRIAQDGHTVGIHSATHVFRDIYSSDQAFFADLHAMQDTIYKYTGQTATLIRFPGGSSNTISKFNQGIMTRLSELVQDHGFRYFDWNVDSDDAGRAKTTDAVYRNVIAAVQRHDCSVVLQHDIKEYSVLAVERIIQWGIANGYSFLPLTADSPDCQHTVQN